MRLAIAFAGIDAKSLHMSPIRINAEGGVSHAKRDVLAGKLTESLSHIDIAASSSIARSEDLELTVVAIAIAIVIAIAVAPPSIPSTAPPISAGPSGELVAIDHTAFAVFEHAILAIAVAGVNAKSLNSSGIGVFAERGVAHAKRDVPLGQLFEAISDVDISLRRAITGLQDLILPVISIAAAVLAEGRSHDHQHESNG